MTSIFLLIASIWALPTLAPGTYRSGESYQITWAQQIQVVNTLQPQGQQQLENLLRQGAECKVIDSSTFRCRIAISPTTLPASLEQKLKRRYFTLEVGELERDPIPLVPNDKYVQWWLFQSLNYTVAQQSSQKIRPYVLYQIDNFFRIDLPDNSTISYADNTSNLIWTVLLSLTISDFSFNEYLVEVPVFMRNL